ncbi:unnamed protein product [Brassica napus]|uniref:(rape) hypothetical protein n=1 Tax=Brassica napus TaxID=3708 RepID=A0A817B8X3_BRANA|nr:unnamed protein product [Brassica napus]
MSNWRRQKPRNSNNNNNNYNNHHHQQRGMTMTQSPKPPLANCKQSVPAWEKDFCAKVGSVPWSKVLEAKRFMHLYERVVQWDDSAGEDAFNKAKSHYWAEINGVSCDLPLPDPDVYIDDVDWDAQVDNELVLDLERGGPDPRTREGEGEGEERVVILDALFSSGQYSGQGWGTGWGDAEGVKEKNVGWDDQGCDGWNQDSWGRKEEPVGWGHEDENNNSFRRETWEYKNRNSFNYKKVGNWNGNDHHHQGREWRKRGAVPREGEQVDDCRWRNGRGRSRGGFQQHSNVLVYYTKRLEGDDRDKLGNL